MRYDSTPFRYLAWCFLIDLIVLSERARRSDIAFRREWEDMGKSEGCYLHNWFGGYPVRETSLKKRQHSFEIHL